MTTTKNYLQYDTIMLSYHDVRTSTSGKIEEGGGEEGSRASRAAATSIGASATKLTKSDV